MKKIKKFKFEKYVKYCSKYPFQLLMRCSIVLLLLIHYYIGNTQQNYPLLYNCEIDSNQELSISHPIDCTLPLSEVCVRVKFHEINNTVSKPNTFKSDTYWNDLLEAVNNQYEGTNIRFVFDGNCIHRTRIPDWLNSVWFALKLTDASGTVWAPPIEVEADDDAINVFFFQTPGIEINRNSVWLQSIGHPSVKMVGQEMTELVHEMGHALSLKHTFKGGGTTIAKRKYWENKARSGPNKNCDQSKIGDEICDTGADPYSMDLEDPNGDGTYPGDNVLDGNQWVSSVNQLSTCIQSHLLLASIHDNVDDETTPWDIPINSIMSYYWSCHSEFSPCQIKRMHNYLDMSMSTHLVQTQCEPELQTCIDITIAGEITWSNGERQLCPNQKIIIENDAKLILDNYKLTRQSSFNGCVDNRYWDGIYLQKGQLLPGFPTAFNYVHSTASLIAMNGSTIEYSKNGITADLDFGIIDLNNTLMYNNGRAISASNFLVPFGFLINVPLNNSGTVNISNNSQIIINDPNGGIVPLKNIQIDLIEKPLAMEKCTMKIDVQNRDVSKIIGIRTLGKSLDISNESFIENFRTATYKDISINPLDPLGFTSSFKLMDSKILNAEIAIDNKSYLVHVEHNYIRGNIFNEGFCYGRWYRNNIGAVDPNNDDAKFNLSYLILSFD